MEGIAEILIAKEKYEDAARVLAFVSHSRDDIRLLRGKAEESQNNQRIERLDHTLGAATHEELRDSASQSDLEENIGLISRMRADAPGH